MELPSTQIPASAKIDAMYELAELLEDSTKEYAGCGCVIDYCMGDEHQQSIATRLFAYSAHPDACTLAGACT